MALRPFKQGPEITVGDGWKMLTAEAGRSAQGLKATIVLANGTGRTRQTIALGQIKQQQALVEHFADFSGIEPQQIYRDLAQLSEAIEGAMRLEETHDQARSPQARDDIGTVLTFENVEPWSTPVSGHQLLSEIAATYGRHLVLPAGGADTLALWTLHAYTYDLGRITPRLGITSPVKRCGKTRVLEALSLLAPRVLMSSSSTPAAIFRAIERWHPTLLIDEADTYLPGNEELRGILNSGHTRRSARILRTVGEAHEPRWFSTWAPMAIAMIGHLPGTLADRAIVLAMQRKRRGDTVERLPLDDTAQPFADLRRQASRWAADHADLLRHHAPHVPEGLHDRAQDNWRPLCALAEVAGGDWPARVRSAIASLEGTEEDEEEIAVMLLADMQQTFASNHTERLFSEDLAQALHTMEGRPWPEYGRQRKPISVNQIARLLKSFDIRPKTLREGTDRAKGYVASECFDAFFRYLPPTPDRDIVTNEQRRSETQKSNRDTDADVTDRKSPNPAPILTCHDVTDQHGGVEEKNHTRTHSDTSLFDAAAEAPVCPECGGTDWVLAVTHRRCALCGAREER